MLVEHFHDLGKVQQRAAEPINFVDHDAVDLAGLNVRPLRVVEVAENDFLGALAGETDPEKKRV